MINFLLFVLMTFGISDRAEKFINRIIHDNRMNMSLLNLFKLNSNHVLIPLTLIISILIGYDAVFLTLTNPCHGGDGGIGCIVLLPFYAVAFPAKPAISIITLLPVEGSQWGHIYYNYLNTVLESYSIFKL